ncbi:MAG: transporter [Phycisphaeraceae bacterium]|nr:transporter [Phycisphaeraceae bacterium]
MIRTLQVIALSLILIALAVSQARAQALPSVNLGLTSFLDGGPPAGPGFYYQQYFQIYEGDTYRDADGDQIAFPDVSVLASLNQFIYQSDQAILAGGKWGIDVIVPVVYIDLDPEVFPLTDSGTGLGDILVGPFIQFDPIMGENGPLFMHRIELQTIFPTGKYDSDDALSPGANVYSFNPYWAFTWFPSAKCEVSGRIHYLWNSENDDPNPVLFGGADDIQPGQALHMNFATSYELIEKKLRAGINGYYLKQITNAKIDGSSVADSKEQVLGIGPGAIYSFSQNDHVFVNAYWETCVENRTEGFRLILRWTHHF